MIKYVVKRSGEVEPFTPSKINGWGIWASKNLQNVDWGGVVLQACSSLEETASSQDLQTALIDECINRRTWNYNRMAGRLYAAVVQKRVFGSDQPLTLAEAHSRMRKAGLISDFLGEKYSTEDYEEINAMIDHARDYNYAHYQIAQFVSKYSIQDRKSGILYETPQLTYMRVAMRIAADQPARMQLVKRLYDYMSKNKINVPTPYFVNSGTTNDGFASCCLYTTDDTAASLAAGDHIAYMMTVASAGIGALINTRTEGEKVRGGLIKHQGKLPYYRALVGAISANLQNGRGGAATITYSVYDPEIETIQKLKNPMTPAARSIRGADYSMAITSHFARLAAKGEDYYTFSYREAKDVYDAMALADEEEFARVYDKAVAEGRYVSKLNARSVLLGALTEAVETGRHYIVNLTEMNRHTPFRDPIWQSNLCQETALPTSSYESVTELYDSGCIWYDKGYSSGEVAVCSLAGINIPYIESDAEYEEAAYLALIMIDVGILDTNFPFIQLAHTAQARMSAGVGIIGLAQKLAYDGLSYASEEGRSAIHRYAERHYYYLLKASLTLGKEKGNAPWIEHTKWGNDTPWLPIDTYNRNTDELHSAELQYDWEALRQEIAENGGIRNSVLVAHMPAESSSISSGTTNGVYPVRNNYLLKTNNTNSLMYVVPESDTFNYESAWDIPATDMIKAYAILQKFTDQAISADLWVNVVGAQRLPASELFQQFFTWMKYGVKTRYYINSRTSKDIDLNVPDLPPAPASDEVGCDGGACTL